MSLVVDGRWKSGGIGRYSDEVIRRLGLEFTCYLDSVSRPSSPLGALRAGRALMKAPTGTVWYSPGFVPPLPSLNLSVSTICDLMYLNPDLASTAQRAYFKRVLARQLRTAPLIFTISEYSARNIRRLLGRSTRRVVNTGCGIDPQMVPKAVPRLSDRPKRVLFVGGSKPNKNLGRALSAFLSTTRRAEFREFELTVLGDVTPEVGQLPSNVHLVGSLGDDELREAYANSRALLMPSIDEGFGLPAIEAIAAGTPVVFGDRGPLRDLVGDLGYGVDPYSVSSIQAGLEDLLLREPEITESQRLQVPRDHDWDNVSRTVESELIALL